MVFDFNDADPQIVPGRPEPVWLQSQSPPPQVDFSEFNDRLSLNLAWVQHFFPNGRLSRDRKHWHMADWTGRAPTNSGSCVIDLTGDKAGYGYDFTTRESEDPAGAIRRASGLTGRALIEELQRWAGMGAVVQFPPRQVAKAKDYSRYAADILAGTQPLAGTLGETYLNARKLTVPATSDLLFHPDLVEGNRGYAGIVAIVRNGKGQATDGIQRTYLADDGLTRARDAVSEKPLVRKSLGPMAGGSVRLVAIGDDGHIGIAEGIETALSVTAIFGVPCWASLGTSGLQSWEWPAEAKRVTIYADARTAGQTSAHTLARRIGGTGIPVEIRSPLHGDDFNDDLQKGVAAADYAQIAPKTIEAIALEACSSEDSIALEFVRRHKDRLRYVNQWKGWMVWDGMVWNTEKTLAAYDMVRSFCREAALVVSEDRKHSATLRKASTIASIETLSRSDRRMAMTIEAWDADDWLLGTPGGIIDLRTGENIGIHPNKYITRIATVTPDPSVSIDTWLGFLRRVTRDNQEVIDYLKRLCGYFLTGSTREHCLPFIFGPGRNGKGTFLNVLIGIMGELHKAADVSTFVEQKNPAHTTELARLHNARLVTCEETEKGQYWAEARLKKLTGGNVITARFMRCDDFEFLPRFKIAIVGNHKPKFRSVDEALRHRLHLIPFEVVIPRDERDHTLGDKLATEYPGILAWMIEGAIEWQRSGLAAPETILTATNEYLDGEDVIGQWLANRCVLAPFEKTNLKVLFDSWSTFCSLTGIKNSGLSKDLASELEKRLGEGCKKTVKGVSRFTGIRLKTFEECRNDAVAPMGDENDD